MIEIPGETLSYPIFLDREAIRQLLPHRGEMQLIQEITVLAFDHFQGRTSWTETSAVLQGHFPNLPIVPGVFLVEAVAQVAGAGMLAGDPRAKGTAKTHLGLLAGIRNCNFKRPVLPGNEVLFDIQTRQIAETAATASATVTVDGNLAANIEIFVINAPRESIVAAITKQLE
jgi:3-hydroxyacyl-[acyl-carrier-protein] dehydratase